MFEQFGLRDHRLGTVREILEDAVLHGGKRDVASPAPYRLVHGIEFEVGDRKNRRASPFSSPDQGLGSRQQFSQIEGLGDVVVGAGIQQGDDRLFFVARRDYQDRRVLPASRNFESTCIPSSLGNIRSSRTRS